MRKRWDEEHAKLKQLVLQLQDQVGLQRRHGLPVPGGPHPAPEFVEGPPTEQPREQQVTMRLKGGRTGKRAVVCKELELTGLMKPFDLEVWYGERVAVLGTNGSGKSHFLRLLAGRRERPGRRAPAGRRPEDQARAAHLQGQARRPGATRLVRADARASRAGRPHAAGDPPPRRRPANGRAGMGREQAARVLDRYELATPAEQRFDRSAAASRHGSRSCCWSCPARRCCCSTSRPTTSTCSRPRRSRTAWRHSRARCSR